MKRVYRFSRLLKTGLFVPVVWILFSGVTIAQVPSETDLEKDPEYQKTQQFLEDTKRRIARARGETNARAKDIEALATRVEELISNIGSTNEDAANLRSELAVKNTLLNLEMEKTSGLRKEKLELNQGIDALKKSKSDSEARLQLKISSLRAEKAKVLKHINELKTKNMSKYEAEAKLQSTIITSLRSENAKVLKRLNELKAQKINKSDLEARLQSTIISLRANNAKVLQRLNELEAQKKSRSDMESKLQSTISSLRAKNTKVLKRINELEEKKKSGSDLEAKLQLKISLLRAEHAKALRRLNEGVETISKQANTNQALKSDLEAANAKIEMLQIEIHILNQRHNIPGKITGQ